MRIISVFLITYVFCAPLALAEKGGAGVRMAQRVLESYIGQRVLVKQGFNTYFSGRIKSVFPPHSDARKQDIMVEIDSLVTQKYVEEPNIDETMTIKASEVAVFQDMTYGVSGSRLNDEFFGLQKNVPVKKGRSDDERRTVMRILAKYKNGDHNTYFDVLVTNIQRMNELRQLEQLLDEPYVVLSKGNLDENDIPLPETLE